MPSRERRMDPAGEALKFTTLLGNSEARMPRSRVFREIPGRKPCDGNGLQVEFGSQPLVHVVQMPRAVKNTEPSLTRGELLLKHRECFLISLRDDHRALFAAKADHQTLHF